MLKVKKKMSYKDVFSMMVTIINYLFVIIIFFKE